MKFFRRAPEQQTIPPTDTEMHEDQDSEFKQVLSEYGLHDIELKTRSHENEAGLHIFVRLYSCPSGYWTELHVRSEKIKKKLRSRGMNVVEIFYSLCN